MRGGRGSQPAPRVPRRCGEPHLRTQPSSPSTFHCPPRSFRCSSSSRRTISSSSSRTSTRGSSRTTAPASSTTRRRPRSWEVPLSSSLFTRSPSPRDLYAGAALLRVAARAAVPPAHERPHVAGAPLTRHVACDAPSLSERLPDFDRASRGSTGTRTRIRCSPTASSLCSVPCTSTRSTHPRPCSGPSFHLSVCSGQGIEPCRGLLARCAFWSQRELPLRRLWLVAGSQPYEPPESIERDPQVSLRRDSRLVEAQSWFADGVI